MLVDNPRDPEAAVRGVFTYQRKGRNDEWEDFHDLDLTRLKKGDVVQLALRSEEVLRLFQGLSALYEIFEQYGIPFGERRFVEAVGPDYWRALAEDPERRDAVFRDPELGAVFWLARWAGERPREAASVLQALSSPDLARLDAVAGIARLQRFLTEWKTNRTNANEEYWQRLLTTESWVIGPLLGSPFMLVGDKAFVGGKTFENKEGRVADFLYKNRLTGNVLLVEIKTPVSALLGSEYRQGVFPPSRDLSGAVSQVIDQRQTLVANYQALDLGRVGAVPFHPRAIALVGDLGQLNDEPRTRSFELYRNELRGVEVVTFDELAAKAEGLLELFNEAA